MTRRAACSSGKGNKNTPNGVSSSKMARCYFWLLKVKRIIIDFFYHLLFLQVPGFWILMKSATWQGKLSQIEVKNRDRSRRSATVSKYFFLHTQWWNHLIKSQFFRCIFLSDPCSFFKWNHDWFYINFYHLHLDKISFPIDDEKSFAILYCNQNQIFI